MNRIYLSLLFCCSVSIAFGQNADLESNPLVDGMWGFQSPVPYKILPRPAKHSNKGQPHTYMPPSNKIQSQPIQPYAYGWFGTKPSPQWSRQFGQQNAYTQWTLR